MKRPCSQCKNKSFKSKFKPVTHVIFDLDGVIVDSENIYKEAYQKTIEDYGHPFQHDFYQQKVSGTPSLNIAKASILDFNLDVTADSFVKKYRGYSRIGLLHLELLPGVERMIKHLNDSGIPIAIATSSARESFLIKTDKFKELIKLFHHVVCGGDPDVKEGKPEPDVYLVCASRFEDKPNPSKCLVFEDSSNGMQAALAAGMQVVLIPHSMVSQEIWKLATLKIDSLDAMELELFGLPPFPDTEPE